MSIKTEVYQNPASPLTRDFVDQPAACIRLQTGNKTLNIYFDPRGREVTTDIFNLNSVRPVPGATSLLYRRALEIA